ncbi:Vacuolar protein sorting-associated protein 74 [Wickerhamiella sorbophila]|uniref:Vacuolar protein sorting-associated protein 74 n=1 Tax=Wickerhamiella sorbophila TaxID=45607 RepID=A0A2T0FLG1_9ASCO|nr:Vacuolar protein sorting-associated protein 74 [Wickerhamiella sorbophila]PRT55810.1 Vacuolar protein sorting-associated protein 74 [Wickerhamiella sorbophila]
MSSGLQRRRGHGGTTATTERGGTFENDDHRVAYDSRDVPSDNDEQAQSRLTLMEEVLLLGIKDEEGYLSFWNDSISYVLRGCIMIELALRGKIAMVNDPVRRRVPLEDRLVELVDSRMTGDVLLDETLRLMKQTEEHLSVATWINYLSGETWNITKISYQLKQVRERLSKGLVDKGILRTEKRNFFLFNMPTHPLADAAVKEEVRRRLVHLVTTNEPNLEPTSTCPAKMPYRYLRTIALVTSAYTGDVLENALTLMGYDARDKAFMRAQALLDDYSEYPFSTRHEAWATALAELVSYETDNLSDTANLSIEVFAAVLKVYTQVHDNPL